VLVSDHSSIDDAFEFNHRGQRSLFAEETGRAFVPEKSNPLPFGTQHLSLFGLKTGDEGKGRSVLEISALLRFLTECDSAIGAVIKANGGANSGHTAAGVKLNLIPSGIVDPNVPNLCLCRGVVADPTKLLWETAALKSADMDPMPRLRLDNRLMVSHIGHRLLDLASEKSMPRGSTGRGITPSYNDETGQHQIFYEDFLGSRANFVEKLTSRLRSCAIRIEHEFGLSVVEWSDLFVKLTVAETRAHRAFIDSGIFTESEFDFTKFQDPNSRFGLNFDSIVEAYWHAGYLTRC